MELLLRSCFWTAFKLESTSTAFTTNLAYNLSHLADFLVIYDVFQMVNGENNKLVYGDGRNTDSY